MIETNSIILFLVSILGFILIWVVIAIALAVWVYRDAESRGMGGVLWLLVVLVTGIIGLIIYLIVREQKVTPTSTSVGSSTNFCPYCGRAISVDATFCSHCGKPIAG